MRAEAIRTAPRWRLPRPSRTTAFVLVLIIHMLLLYGLLIVAPRVKLADMGINAIEAFNIPEPAAESEAEPPPAAATPAEAPQPKVPPRATAPTIDAPAPPVDLGVLPLEFDLRKVPSPTPEPAPEQSAEAALPDSRIVSNPAAAPAYGPSLNGPPRGRPSPLAGKTLYAAEWYREPTDAELAFYLPKTGVPAGSWALVACRTVANFHVEDCQEMGDSQPGSGLSRAIRNAAWQFRVRPPRVGGEYKVGEWVQIRIDFTRPPEGEGPG
ncbi:hypothetical protein [Polymorphobacter sp.]|uniref:hypothetical protein n=1 Tax=Polymorphobacter sp. TaxID=1909290 RepID=UPI003F6F3354